MPNYLEAYRQWLKSPCLTPCEREELASIEHDEAQIKERFFAPLEFGTAGLRGICQLGTNRMNRFVVASATQAFSDVLKDSGLPLSCIICYDCRLTSVFFAKTAAAVLAANGIEVKLFSAMRPTPELSFAIRHFKASCGINITASHNPKEYNGYKVYFNDGAQLMPCQSLKIASNMESHDIFSYPLKGSFDDGIASGKITFIDESFDDIFIDAVLKTSILKEEIGKAQGLSVVYTPFHGTGAYIVPKLLKKAGLKALYTEESQMMPDGSFPFVPNPNPESEESFALAEALALKVKAQIIIATDPDCDRIGVKVLNKSGGYTFLSGNEVGIVLFEYIISSLKATHSMPQNPAVITTIVTSKLIEKMAEQNGILYLETFTGFKNMAEKISQRKDINYIFAFEESLGYMSGDHVRDKDGGFASLLITELAAYCHNRNLSVLDYLENIYKKYGFSLEKTINTYMYGTDGIEKMSKLMKNIRNAPPCTLAGLQVRHMLDYKTGKIYDLEKKYCETLDKHGSNVVSFILSDGSTVIVRPSGTEPKVKIYILLKGKSKAELSLLCTALEEQAYSLIQQYSEV